MQYAFSQLVKFQIGSVGGEMDRDVKEGREVVN